jgi:N12 class adenine-specific DNA methylase
MDFHFANHQPLAWSGPVEKAKGNVAAIHLARQLAAEGRRPANPQEQASLSRYVGWGHTEVLNYALDKLDLLTLLSEDEWEAVKASTLNAHYTALPVIAAIWRGFERLGAGKLDSLNVLDPSAGVGHFKSMMPESLREKANWVEVELDKVTAAILAALHPESKVFGMGYEQVNLPRGHFDIITSNVPFGNYPVAFDGLPRHLRTSIHDFYFARSLDLLRPGGVMAFITSRYTLDKKDDLVRKHLAEHCDLLVAVRLPNNAFASNAGTEVVTDLLFLRKRFAPNKELPAWADVRQETLQHHERDWAAEKFWLNRHYLHHPECVLGKQAALGTMYRNYEYTVLPDERDLGEAISARLESFLPEGLLTIEAPKTERATVLEIQAETIESAPVPETARVKAMREIYTTARQLLKNEANAQPGSVLRHKLNGLYDDFVARHGFLNDPANTRPLKGEPELLFLKALEVQGMGTWLKADMFSKTTVRQANPLEQTDDPNDALLLCLDKLGRVDIPTIAEITGGSPEDVIRHLAGGRIFLDPETKQWVTDDRYLSGNVAAKLEAAQAAAMFDEQYQINVEALRLAQPEPLKADEIHAPLGAGWIPESDIEAFFRELLESQRISATYVPGTAEWIVEVGYGVPSGVRSRWSTARVDLEVIVTDTLNSRQTVVYDLVETPDGKDKRVVNHDATVAAQARQAELKAAFDNWVWMNVERTERLVALYNKRYNIWRTPRFDGAHLTFPGLNTDISLRKSQRNGAWHILQHQAALMFHQVGSGKTLTAIVAAMEARRLGLARKVMAVVPNQVVGQWQAETLRAYPSARILTVSSGDFSKSKRGTFLSRIATGDWDLILVPYSVFKLLPMSAKAEIEFIEGQVAELEKYLWELKAQSEKKESVAAAIKSIERSKRAFEARLLEKKRMAKDSPDTITYEMLGVDMLVVDEFHSFKNLFFKTRINRIAGLPNSESQRAFDMYMKTRWSIQRGGKVVALTGTPVSNTLAEAFTMQRYLQEHALGEMGLTHFDAWAYQYAQAEPGIEMTPDGSGFRMNTRFRRFKNLSDLYAVFLQVTDPYAIQKGDIPGMPENYAGGLVKVKCKRDPRLRAYTLELGERTERIKSGAVKPEQDNMLKVSSDGRKAALDVSLVLASDPNGPMPKVDKLVETVAAIHRMSTPMRGAQLVFCDLATPKARKAREAEVAEDDDILTGEEASLTTDIYAQIKRRLARRGIQEAEIAFAHDAKSTEQKTALYKAVNEGRKRVVIASTEKMGVGVNVQERLLAVHHLTPTWRPDGLRQRTGRMERPGNRYGQVFEFVYVTPGSFDGFMWQNLEAKLGFIKDLERGLVQREAEDIGDDVVSYATIKAMSSGNPLMLKKVELDSKMHRLEALRREWLRNRTGMAREKGYVERRIPETEACIRFLEADLAQREQTGKEFSATIGDVTCTEREAAGNALRQAAQMQREAAVIGAYRGLNLVGMTRHAMGQLGLEPEQVIGLALSNGDILQANSEVTDKGLFSSLDAVLRSLDKKLEQAREQLVRLQSDLASLESEIRKAWQHDDAFEKAATELAAINAELDRWSRQQAEKKEGEDQDIDMTVADNDDGWLDIFQAALARIDEMHQQPIEVELPEPAIPVTPEAIEQARQQVARSQAQLDFIQAVASVPQPLAQMSMFAEVVPVKTERRKRR